MFRWRVHARTEAQYEQTAAVIRNAIQVGGINDGHAITCDLSPDHPGRRLRLL